jgi:sporulation protein YlmC with PRC-barrel domain
LAARFALRRARSECAICAARPGRGARLARGAGGRRGRHDHCVVVADNQPYVAHFTPGDPMTNTKNLLRIAACAVASLGSALAQEPQPHPTTPQQPAPGVVCMTDYCSASKLLGAEVRMNPGAEARRDAEKEGEAAKKPKGKIDDVLVDTRTGDVKYAIVSFGGFIGIGDKTVAVPVSLLTWTPAHERFDLAASEDRLKECPAFDLDKAKKAGLDNSVKGVDGQWRANVAEASARKGEVEVKDPVRDPRTDPKVEAKDLPQGTERRVLTGTPFYIVPTNFVCLSEIDDYPVYAGAEKFGKVSDVLVDRGQRNVALLVVKRGGALGIGGTEYLVPYRAMYFCAAPTGDDRMYCVDCNAAKLETAVLYEKPKKGIVDEEAAKRALSNDTFRKTERVNSDKTESGDKR